MSGVLASMIDGVLVGSVYGLAAMGLSLIWGVMDVINLTHGAMIALGMFCMYLLFSASHINAYLLLLPTIGLGLILGLVVYWMSVHWVVGRSMLMSLLSTFAVNMIIIGVGTALWSTSPYNVNLRVRSRYHRRSLHVHRKPHRGILRSSRHRPGTPTLPQSHASWQSDSRSRP